MSTDRHVTLFHSPRSRAAGVHILLNELDADFDLHVLDLQKNQQREPAFLAINPMGKVPAIRHGEAVVTEQSAVYLYLGDLYADRGLAPQMGDPLRGAYLRWLAFYGSCFEPAIIDRYMKREPAPAGMNPYGDFDTMFGTLTAQLERGDWILGDRYTVADVLWGAALTWMIGFGIVPATPLLQAYIDRFNARPKVMATRTSDAQLAASMS